MIKKRQIELLAPARDSKVAMDAISHGADAVYMGAARFGARSSAGNTVDEISAVCAYAHQYNAKVYVTVNTIIYDDELADVERLIWELYYVGVDALIVQDMGILRMNLPPIALHASTQCDLRDSAKAKFLESMGFTQLVMARELTLQEIAEIHASVKVPLEAFVHGALCVSYSGRCQASYGICGRSANRGECAQICRLKYDLVDEDGNALIKGKHLLSLRDNNQSQNLRSLVDAGVSSFKIEGRLKDSSYVKNVVAYYRQALDAIIDADESLQRSSSGKCRYTFKPNLSVAFNRGFTDYFVNRRNHPNGYSMASLETPKAIGEKLGTVISAHGIELKIRTQQHLANGDGLSFIGADGDMVGARVNRVEADRIYLRDRIAIPKGTTIYRTFNKEVDDVLSRQSAERKIAVKISLREVDGKLVADCADERGNTVTHAFDIAVSKANTPQALKQRDTLSKMGNTIYFLKDAACLDDVFVPMSALSQVRRDILQLLDRAQLMRYNRPKKGKEQTDFTTAASLKYADNVANHLAAEFYRSHGVVDIEPAMETWPKREDVIGHEVMHTRYCIRRELGCCLKGKDGSKLPNKLYLRCGNTAMQVKCDCAKCEMHLTLLRK